MAWWYCSRVPKKFHFCVCIAITKSLFQSTMRTRCRLGFLLIFDISHHNPGGLKKNDGMSVFPVASVPWLFLLVANDCGRQSGNVQTWITFCILQSFG
jgi:hypothetical protein